MKDSGTHLFLAAVAAAAMSTAAFAQSTPPAPGAAASQTPATAADFAAGASVRDSKGASIGKIDSVDTAKGDAVVDTGQTKIGVPMTMFTKDSQGVMLKFTADQFNQAIAKAHARSAAAAQQATPSTSQPQPR